MSAALEKAAPEKAALEKAAPEKAAPEKAAPEKAAPEKACRPRCRPCRRRHHHHPRCRRPSLGVKTWMVVAALHLWCTKTRFRRQVARAATFQQAASAAFACRAA